MGTQLAGEGKSCQRRVPGWRAVEVVCDGGEQAMTRGQKTVYTWPVHFSYYCTLIFSLHSQDALAALET